MRTEDLNLGDKAKEDITGFEGVVTGIIHYISGCDQALLAPPVKADGSYVKAEWFDIDRIEVTEAKKFLKSLGRVGSRSEGPPAR